jgi:hypothetical protein
MLKGAKMMWVRRLGIALFMLAIGIVLLTQPNLNTEDRVRAEAPARASNSSSKYYFPFITRNFTLTVAPLWRFGVDKMRRPFSAYNSLDVAAMRLGWYIDFSVTASPELPYGMEYMPMVRMKQWKKLANGTPTICCVVCAYLDPPSYTIWPSLSQIQSIAASRPGMTWIVGNEMERIDWGGLGGVCAYQDEMLPEVYAQAYHEVYTALKSADPTAQVSIGALVQPSPLRIEYLQRVWDKYDQLYGNGRVNTMPVEVWNVHVYVYNEEKNSWGADIPAGLAETVGSVYQIRDHKNFNLAAQMLVGWRTWMKNHGQQQKPLITPEYGVVIPEWVQDPPGVTTFSPPQIRDEFMYPSFDYFLNQKDANLGFSSDQNRLMQRWAWWSMDYDDGECDTGVFYPENNGNLFYSGLGPSLPPTNCPYPWQGRSPFWTYWTQYVQPLPAGSIKPYAPVSVASAPQPSNAPQKSAVSAAVLMNVANAPECSDSPAVRARFFQTLPGRDTPEGQRAWITALSKLTAGTRICLP